MGVDSFELCLGRYQGLFCGFGSLDAGGVDVSCLGLPVFSSWMESSIVPLTFNGIQYFLPALPAVIQFHHIGQLNI